MTAVLKAVGMEKRLPAEQQMLLKRRDTFQVLQRVDLALYSGQTLGVVGESGNGKSTLREISDGLQQPTSGIVRYKGQDIRSLGEKEYRRLRRNVQYTSQNPKESMNPYYTAGRVLVEPMKTLVDDFKPCKARETMREMFSRVGLPDSILGRCPSELNGRQCQRIVIARALLPSPEVIICDEYVSAPDVSIQTQTLSLLEDLQKELSTVYLFVSHDIGVIHYMSDFIAMINCDRIMEQGEGGQLIHTPKDDYTKRLIVSPCSTGEDCVCDVR